MGCHIPPMFLRRIFKCFSPAETFSPGEVGHEFFGCIGSEIVPLVDEIANGGKDAITIGIYLRWSTYLCRTLSLLDISTGLPFLTVTTYSVVSKFGIYLWGNTTLSN